MKHVLDTIHSRSSIRKFSTAPLERVQIEEIVRAGMAAPTAGNRQPWAFIAVDDASVLSDLAAGLPYAKFAANAPAAILVCGDLSKAFDGVEESLWIQDCSAACQNILLACHAMGLGATWTAIYPLEDRVTLVRHALNLPDHIVPLSLIPVGVPDQKAVIKDKWNADLLHWQRWE